METKEAIIIKKKKNIAHYVSKIEKNQKMNPILDFDSYFLNLLNCQGSDREFCINILTIKYNMKDINAVAKEEY